jgi:hypothetical protein
MSFSHQLSITGPSGAPPETAVIRFVAHLPEGWQAEVGGFQGDLARLVITPPPGTTASEATQMAADILSRPGLQGWRLTDH